MLVGSGHGYQLRFRLRAGLGWVGFSSHVNWKSIGVVGCVHGSPVGYLLHKLELKNIDHYRCWLVLDCVHGLPVGLVLCSVHRQFEQCAQEPPDETRQDWTGLDWTHDPHPPWLGLSKVTAFEQGVPEVSAPHIQRRALTSGTSCSSRRRHLLLECLTLWAYYPV